MSKEITAENSSESRQLSFTIELIIYILHAQLTKKSSNQLESSIVRNE